MNDMEYTFGIEVLDIDNAEYSSMIRGKNNALYCFSIPMPSYPLVNVVKKNGTRYDKVQNKRVNTITTIVQYNGYNYGSATCDESEYDEREGVLNAIANNVLGNFDREYDKYKKQREKKYQHLCKCSTCGKTYDTPEQARECENKHIENKKERHERYRIRAEAKRRLAAKEYEAKVIAEMNKITKEENTK